MTLPGLIAERKCVLVQPFLNLLQPAKPRRPEPSSHTVGGRGTHFPLPSFRRDDAHEIAAINVNAVLGLSPQETRGVPLPEAGIADDEMAHHICDPVAVHVSYGAEGKALLETRAPEGQGTQVHLIQGIKIRSGQDGHGERPQIERKSAEYKQSHGLRRARYWGLAKVTIQTLMVALVVNLKRCVTLLKQRSPAFSWANVA
jgi:hypothetical protein